MQSLKDTRINLHIFVDENGKEMYHVMHLGFFPTSLADTIARKLDARGIAFHSNFEHQRGRVDVVTSANGPDSVGNVRFATYEYEPRRAKSEVDEPRVAA